MYFWPIIAKIKGSNERFETAVFKQKNKTSNWVIPLHPRFHASCGEFSFPAYQILTCTGRR